MPQSVSAPDVAPIARRLRAAPPARRREAVEHAVTVFYGGKEAYGFHALEAVQALTNFMREFQRTHG